MAKTRRIGATDLFFDLCAARPKVNSVDEWLKRMEQLRAIAGAS